MKEALNLVNEGAQPIALTRCVGANQCRYVPRAAVIRQSDLQLDDLVSESMTDAPESSLYPQSHPRASAGFIVRKRRTFKPSPGSYGKPTMLRPIWISR